MYTRLEVVVTAAGLHAGAAHLQVIWFHDIGCDRAIFLLVLSLRSTFTADAFVVRRAKRADVSSRIGLRKRTRTRA